MPFFIRIAFRYLISKRKLNAISFIIYLSIIGITLGTASLIIILSIFNGFRNLTETQLSGFDPHIRLIPQEGKYFSYNDSIKNIIEATPYLQDFEPVLEGKAIISKDNNISYINLRSTSFEEDSPFLDRIQIYLYGNSTNIVNFRVPKIYIGHKIAESINIQLNDKIVLYSPQMLERSITSFQYIQAQKAIVNSYLMTNIKNYDAEMAIADYDFVKKVLLAKKSSYSTIDINLKNKEKIIEAKKYLQNNISNIFQILDWKDINSKLLKIMELERISTFLILGIIILIASFNILISITMTILEKRKDIALMQSFGATKDMVRKIFLFEGVVIGLISTSLGLIIGLLFNYLQSEYGLLALDGNKYIINAIPVDISTINIIIIACFSLSLSIISTLYPAYKAGRITITSALREE